MEKLIDEIWDGSLEEEEAKDGKPNFPKLQPQKRQLQKRELIAFKDKNSLRSEYPHGSRERKENRTKRFVIQLEILQSKDD